MFPALLALYSGYFWALFSLQSTSPQRLLPAHDVGAVGSEPPATLSLVVFVLFRLVISVSGVAGGPWIF